MTTETQAPEGGRAAFESVVWRDTFGQPLTYRERELCWHAWQTALAAQSQPGLHAAARHVITQRERYGWSPEADQAIYALADVIKGSPAPAEGDAGLPADATAEQAEAWMAVCDVLHEIRPGWHANGETGMAAALATIRQLAQPNVQPKGPAEAWMHEDDPSRVISAVQKAQAEKDGGASASSVKPYSIRLTRPSPAPEQRKQTDSVLAEAVRRLLKGNEWRQLQGEWAWHSKTMPANDDLTFAREALEAHDAGQAPAVGADHAAVMQQALETLEAAPRVVEHVLPFSNVCNCTLCESARAAKSAMATLRSALPK